MGDYSWSSTPVGKRVTPTPGHRVEIHVELLDYEGTGDREEFDRTDVTSVEWNTAWLEIEHDKKITVFPRDALAQFHVRQIQREEDPQTVKPAYGRNLDSEMITKLMKDR